MKTILLRRDHKWRWEKIDPVLGPGEPGYELDTGKMKVGDGDARWTDLPYFTPIPEGSDVSDAVLLAHIDSTTPHPVYDDMPSLTLLFENGLI
jgi:hypothetical protein